MSGDEIGRDCAESRADDFHHGQLAWVALIVRSEAGRQFIGTHPTQVSNCWRIGLVVVQENAVIIPISRRSGVGPLIALYKGMAVRSSSVVRIAFAALALCLHLPWTTGAMARGSIRLGEVIPALAETPAGDVVVSDAPPPGAKRRVSKREIVKALREAGLNPIEFRVPRSVVISRRARKLDRAAASRLVSDALRQALAPCETSAIRVQGAVRVPEGELDIELPRRPKLRSGRMSFVVAISGAGAIVRIPVSATLVCPPTAIQAGMLVKLVVNLGAVRASAAGKAQQPGRVGDTVRVKNLSTGTVVSGRVIDSQRVEVYR